MKKAFVVLFAMLFSFASIAQTSENPSSTKRGLFSGRDKYGWVEAKLGRAFLRAGEVTGEDAQVFYGGAGLGVGVVLNKTMLGIGGAFECVDLMDKSYSFPLFVELRHYIGRDSSRGFLLGVKGGWILGGKKAFSTVKPIGEEEELVGTTTRSMQGPYGEAMVGFHYRQFDFFVAYNYRVVKYDTNYVYGTNAMPNYDESWKRSMHVVMGGVSFRFF